MFSLAHRLYPAFDGILPGKIGYIAKLLGGAMQKRHAHDDLTANQKKIYHSPAKSHRCLPYCYLPEEPQKNHPVQNLGLL
jgi:hypothetical protein